MEQDMSTTIDPIEYGKLLSTVESLKKQVESMDGDIKTLLELANKSRGGFWAGMTIASFVGGLVTFLTNNFLHK